MSSGGSLAVAHLSHRGQHLNPREFHAKLQKGRESGDLIVVDVRNSYEYKYAPSSHPFRNANLGVQA